MPPGRPGPITPRRDVGCSDARCWVHPWTRPHGAPFAARLSRCFTSPSGSCSPGYLYSQRLARVLSGSHPSEQGAETSPESIPARQLPSSRRCPASSPDSDSAPVRRGTLRPVELRDLPGNGCSRRQTLHYVACEGNGRSGWPHPLMTCCRWRSTGAPLSESVTLSM